MVFNEHLIKRRVAAAEELNLMLMRSSRHRPWAAGECIWISMEAAWNIGTMNC